MKPGIHPDYHPIKVTMTDGTEYTTRSTWGKAGDNLQLDIDSRTHPAWTGGQQHLLDRGGRLSRFQKKFAGFMKTDDQTMVQPAKKEAAPKAEKPAKKK